MMRIICDFKDIRKLEDSSLADEIREGIIVTATVSLSHSLCNYYPLYKVIGVNEIIDYLVPGWNEDSKKIYNYITVRNAIRDYALKQTLEKNLFLSLERNAYDLWNAIVLLTEADIYPRDVTYDEVGELPYIFKKLWEQLENENESLINLRHCFANDLSNQDTLMNKIKECVINRIDDVSKIIEKKKLFLIGFYFITPLQARIFDLMEQAGFELVYLNCHDEHYKFFGEIWEKTFESEYSTNNYFNIQNNITLPNIFGDILEKKNSIDGDIEIIQYSTELDFVKAIKEPLQNGHDIYTPNLKECQKLLKEYYPEFFTKKHLLAYPVGQYLYYLHLMWNSLHLKLELKYEYVYKCFESGWLEEKDFNGREYLYELSKIEVFFKDCVSFEDWRERLNTLKIAKTCTAVFDFKDDESYLTNERWHTMLGNPFRNLSIYNIDNKKLEEIEILLLKLMKTAEFLFDIEDKTTLNKHFDRIKKVLNDRLEKEDLFDDEIAIAKGLIKILENNRESDIESPLNAIKDAIVLLFDSDFEDNSKFDHNESIIDNKIFPLSQIECCMLDNYGQDLYLVLTDEFTLPGGVADLPWPLNNHLLDSLRAERDSSSKYLKNMKSIIKNNPLSYRYLFYSFISNINKSSGNMSRHQ